MYQSLQPTREIASVRASLQSAQVDGDRLDREVKVPALPFSGRPAVSAGGELSGVDFRTRQAMPGVKPTWEGVVAGLAGGLVGLFLATNLYCCWSWPADA